MEINIPNDKFFYTETGLKRLALYFIGLIRKRTLSGLDKNGQPFKAYSTRPLAIPAGTITKRSAKSLVSANEATYFEHNGMLWIVIYGGYKSAKKAMKENTDWDDTVNLSLSGSMLKSLVPVTYTSDGSITIGFSRSEDAQKAQWNANLGREFLGLTEAELHSPDTEQLILQALKVRE